MLALAMNGCLLTLKIFLKKYFLLETTGERRENTFFGKQNEKRWGFWKEKTVRTVEKIFGYGTGFSRGSRWSKQKRGQKASGVKSNTSLKKGGKEVYSHKTDSCRRGRERHDALKHKRQNRADSPQSQHCQGELEVGTAFKVYVYECSLPSTMSSSRMPRNVRFVVWNCVLARDVDDIHACELSCTHYSSFVCVPESGRGGSRMEV